MEQAQLQTVIEAALLASSQPMSANQLGALFAEEEGVTREHIAKGLEALAASCADRGVELVEVASGFRLQIRQAVYPWVSRLWTERPSRYSRALLETLALIAYRQPITRGEIEAIRGVVVSSSIVKTLEEREWIRVVGHRDVPGKPALFGTTRQFLDYFNLSSLDQLPTLAEVRDMEDLDPQMDLDKAPAVARAAHPGTDQTADDDIRPDAQALAVHAERAGAEAGMPSATPPAPPSGAPPNDPIEDAADALHESHTTADEAEAGAEATSSDPQEPEENRA